MMLAWGINVEDFACVSPLLSHDKVVSFGIPMMVSTTGCQCRLTRCRGKGSELLEGLLYWPMRGCDASGGQGSDGSHALRSDHATDQGYGLSDGRETNHDTCLRP
ncbi:hypothetical protein ACLOJK_012619 [Asimina triloba]